MLLEVMKDASELLAGEAAAAGKKTRARSSAMRLSSVAEALRLAFSTLEAVRPGRYCWGVLLLGSATTG